MTIDTLYDIEVGNVGRINLQKKNSNNLLQLVQLGLCPSTTGIFSLSFV